MNFYSSSFWILKPKFLSSNSCNWTTILGTSSLFIYLFILRPILKYIFCRKMYLFLLIIGIEGFWSSPNEDQTQSISFERLHWPLGICTCSTKKFIHWKIVFKDQIMKVHACPHFGPFGMTFEKQNLLLRLKSYSWSHSNDFLRVLCLVKRVFKLRWSKLAFSRLFYKKQNKKFCPRNPWYKIVSGWGRELEHVWMIRITLLSPMVVSLPPYSEWIARFYKSEVMWWHAPPNWCLIFCRILLVNMPGLHRGLDLLFLASSPIQSYSWHWTRDRLDGGRLNCWCHFRGWNSCCLIMSEWNFKEDVVLWFSLDISQTPDPNPSIILQN